MTVARNLIQALKHLPGQHPQKSHGGGRGAKTVNSSLNGADGKQSKLFKKFNPKDIVERYGDKFYSGEDIAEGKLRELEMAGGTQAGVASYVAGLVEYVDEETGYGFSNITFDEYTVDANIVDREGKAIGIINREFDHDSKVVDHTGMKLNWSDMEGKGFGSRFYHESEKAYKQAGFEAVTLNANLDVGGYAWARMGYDAQESSDFTSAAWSLNTQHYLKYGEFIPTEVKSNVRSMSDIAAFTGPDGQRLGKAALLGTSWLATKNLDDNDPGYQAGIEYYRQKGVDVD